MYDDPLMTAEAVSGEGGRGSTSFSRRSSGTKTEAFEPRFEQQRPPKTNQDAADAAGAGVVAALMEVGTRGDAMEGCLYRGPLPCCGCCHLTELVLVFVGRRDGRDSLFSCRIEAKKRRPRACCGRLGGETSRGGLVAVCASQESGQMPGISRSLWPSTRRRPSPLLFNVDIRI